MKLGIFTSGAGSRAVTAKKCTKKRARAELLFCQTKPIVFLPFSLRLPSSLLPNVGQMFLGVNMNHLITGYVSQRA